MTFPSTLIIGTDFTSLLNILGHTSLQNPDLLIIDSDYSIESVRKIENFLQKLSYNHKNKIILIKDIENLDIPAQNCLLKNLEEPGKNNYFIITTQNQSKILSTIISRCHLIIQKPSPSTLEQTLPIPTDTKSALEISSSIEKNKIKPILLNELNFLHTKLVKKPNQKITQKITNLLKAIEYINSNLDPRLALDYFLLKNLN